MKKEYFNIPNMMGYFRILMIPVFLWLYIGAQTPGRFAAAFVVLGVSLLTDFLDGKVARRFNMVTDFGKALDPVADKLTLGALAIAVLNHYPGMIVFLGVFLCKEIYMSLMGLYLRKKKNIVYGAQMHGKVCTVVTDAGIGLMLLFPEMPYRMAYLLMVVMLVCMLVSWYRYVMFHIGCLKGRGESVHLRFIGWFIAGYLILGALVPYLGSKEVSQEYADNFNVEDFYGGESDTTERAALIEDNEEALEERIRLIEQAEEEIIFSTFDFWSDDSGKMVISALIAAADRGVEVKILLDGYSVMTHMKGNPYFYPLLCQENVEIKVYNPVNLLTPWTLMSRMHDKYLIADGEVYLLGGRNNYDYFLGETDGKYNYDREVLIVNTGQGDSVGQLITYFEEIWDLACCKVWSVADWVAGTTCVKNAQAELMAVYENLKTEHGDWCEAIDYEERTVEVEKVTLLYNPTNPTQKEPWIFYSLCQLMEEATDQVLIHTPYIICNKAMYQAFTELCQGDAEIIMMTNSAQNNGNYFGAADFVRNKKKILATGLIVLEYDGDASYHGKSVVIDDNLAVVGSFNQDRRSVYQDTETMLVICGEEFTEILTDQLMEYQEDAKEAVVRDNTLQELLEDADSRMEAVIRIAVWIADPLLRFVM